MKLLSSLAYPLSNGRRLPLAIAIAALLSFMVAAASTYLFVSAGRGELPQPLSTEILAPAPVEDVAPPPPIQVPAPVETAPPELSAAVVVRPPTAVAAAQEDFSRDADSGHVEKESSREAGPGEHPDESATGSSVSRQSEDEHSEDRH